MKLPAKIRFCCDYLWDSWEGGKQQKNNDVLSVIYHGSFVIGTESYFLLEIEKCRTLHFFPSGLVTLWFV